MPGYMRCGLAFLCDMSTKPMQSYGENSFRTMLKSPFLIGAIFVWTSPRKQYLGDKVAHTIIIKTR
ncbi:hypothetical protein [Ktedonospora formicarum]|uniref:Uncharacterized protein n=1 Tax=Ktedonospora formicarum TaxID=2778364 RepID=A0A8J3MUT0_9CHLR|nr:hypothetical protein [Ktedonospora formicarum]GHO46918.1 hypothetical protein KSX_50810 [Ktedonospora formicarum]